MSIPGVEHRTVRSFDDTEIAYQVRGAGPAVVLTNGLGGTYAVWRHQYAALGEGYRIISFDYRGLFRSARPADLSTLALSIQACDLEAVLAAERVEHAVFVGWSMGVQYNFEYYRRRPEQFAGIVALNGTAGSPFETVFGLPQLRHVVPLLLSAMKRSAALLGPATRAVAGWRGLIPTMKRLGLVGSGLDREVFDDLAQEFAGLDFEAYAETMRQLGLHDASDVLPQITVPVLIIAGSRDVMTPLQTAEAMRDRIPDARLEEIPGGTHYTAVEQPDKINELLTRFVSEVTAR